MQNRVDKGHRDWADHKGEEPTVSIDVGPENIQVTLDAWGPKENVYSTIYRQLESNWGDEPVTPRKDDELSDEEMAQVENCIAGRSIQNPLEAVNLMFTINGISRACTHQLVRTRIGASFMQHGGRDNDWRHRHWSMPEAIYRACREHKKKTGRIGLQAFVHPSPITNWEPIKDYLLEQGEMDLFDAIESYILQGRKLYSALVDGGIAFQDARHVLHIGTETYIHANYNYLALRGLMNNRLEHVNDWEINCVSQLMVREVRMKMPSLFGKYLISHSDKLGKAAYAGLDSWPPDQKYPAKWKQSERKFRPEQNPFFVLTEEAMRGGEIEWIPTNGIYPNRERNEEV